MQITKKKNRIYLKMEDAQERRFINILLQSIKKGTTNGNFTLSGDCKTVTTRLVISATAKESKLFK